MLRGALELLTGQPGLGKSQVQIHYMACATAGLPWPDGAAAIEPINVIMVTAEDSRYRSGATAAGGGADLKRVHILKYIKTDKKQRQFLLAKIGKAGTDHQADRQRRADLHRSDHRLHGRQDELQKATEVRSQLGPLKDFAERTNIAVSAITHPAKNASAKAIDHFIGSQAFVAAARIGHACFEEMEVNEETGEKMPTGRILYTNPKNNAHVRMDTLAFKIESATIIPEPFFEIETSHVVWEKEAIKISADEASLRHDQHRRASKRGSVTREVVDFLRQMLDLATAGASKRRSAEQGKALGYSDKEIRLARKNSASFRNEKEDSEKTDGGCGAMARSKNKTNRAWFIEMPRPAQCVFSAPSQFCKGILGILGKTPIKWAFSKGTLGHLSVLLGFCLRCPQKAL